jgi:uncharacterized lipoprotein YbaY
MRKNLVFLGIVVVVLVLVAGCSGGRATPPPPAKVTPVPAVATTAPTAAAAMAAPTNAPAPVAPTAGAAAPTAAAPAAGATNAAPVAPAGEPTTAAPAAGPTAAAGAAGAVGPTAAAGAAGPTAAAPSAGATNAAPAAPAVEPTSGATEAPVAVVTAPAAQPATAPTQIPPAAATAAARATGILTTDLLKTHAYAIPDVGTVNLIDGEGDLQGVSTTAQAHAVYQTAAFGDLNGDKVNDAAVVVAVNTGGSGTFYYLITLVQQNGKVNQVAAALLGDRVQINSLGVANGKITVDMVTQGPNDPMCCPTQHVVQTYQLQGSTLKLVSTTPQAVAPAAQGTPGAAAPAPTARPTAIRYNGLLTGTVSYMQRIALPPQAVIEVTLQDVSRADAPAIILARQRTVAGGRQVPIAYRLTYGPSWINPAHTYSVRATITENGKLAWTSTKMYLVLTRGAPVTGVEILVEQVGVPPAAAAPAPAASATVTSTVPSGAATPAASTAMTPTVTAGATPAAPAASAAMTTTVAAGSATAVPPASTAVTPTVPSKPVTPTVAAGAAAAPAATPAVTTTAKSLNGVLNGTVTYLERIALPANAVVQIELQDMSQPDVPPVILSYQRIVTNGKQVPIPFKLQYDPAQIDPKGTYALAARITVGRQLRWINNEPVPVLTQGSPTDNVRIIVHRVITQ